MTMRTEDMHQTNLKTYIVLVVSIVALVLPLPVVTDTCTCTDQFGQIYQYIKYYCKGGVCKRKTTNSYPLFYNLRQHSNVDYYCMYALHVRLSSTGDYTGIQCVQVHDVTDMEPHILST